MKIIPNKFIPKYAKSVALTLLPALCLVISMKGRTPYMSHEYSEGQVVQLAMKRIRPTKKIAELTLRANWSSSLVKAGCKLNFLIQR